MLHPWSRIHNTGERLPFRDWVAESLRSKVLHNPSNWLTPTARVRALASQYDDFLGKSALRALPVRPNFIFCATDLGHGSPWHFERDLMGSEIEGWFANDDFTIGDAVAASSCFPPVFSPMILKLPQPVGKGSPGPLLIERALYWPDGQANAGHGYVDPRSIEPSREVGERLTSQELLSMSARGTRGRTRDRRTPAGVLVRRQTQISLQLSGDATSPAPT